MNKKNRLSLSFQVESSESQEGLIARSHPWTGQRHRPGGEPLRWPLAAHAGWGVAWACALSCLLVVWNTGCATSGAGTSTGDASAQTDGAVGPGDASDQHDAGAVDAGECECSTGPCCDGCHMLGTDHVCQEASEVEYGCQDGEEPGDDLYMRTQDRLCSGTSPQCNGVLSAPGPWTLAMDCDLDHHCSAADGTCVSNSATCDCSSGPCCDGCHYLPPTTICENEAESEYYCPSGSGVCGGAVAVHYRDRYCPGNSATCSGSLGSWGMPNIVENCGQDAFCETGVSTCQYDNSVCCAASSYWDPTSMVGSDTDVNTGVTLEAEFEDRGAASSIGIRICKFYNGQPDEIYETLHVRYRDMLSYCANFTGDVPTNGTSCTDWFDMDTSSCSEGDQLGGLIKIISPASYASYWNTSDVCSEHENDEGLGMCWSAGPGTLVRTCKE